MKPGLLYFLLGLGGVLFVALVLILSFWLKGQRLFQDIRKNTPIISIKKPFRVVDNVEQPQRLTMTIPFTGNRLITAGKYLLTTDSTTHGTLYENDVKIIDILLTRPAERISVSDVNGSVAYVDSHGVLHVCDTITTNIIQLQSGWTAKHVQWDKNILWVSAFNEEQSGALFYTKNTNDGLTMALKPITHSTPNDMFGYCFHMNNDYLVVAHMLDRNAHVFTRDDHESDFRALTIIDPKRDTSMFPYSLGISADGNHIYMGNPTESIGSQNEVGTVIHFTNGMFQDIYTNGTSWFGRNIQVHGSDDHVLISDDSFYYQLSPEHELIKHSALASFMSEDRLAVQNGDKVSF
jgi:hypothetical protein